MGGFAEYALAVGIAVPIEENVGKVFFVLPGRCIDSKLCTGLVDSRHAREKPVGGSSQSLFILRIAARFLDLRKEVFADKVVIGRLIEPGNRQHGFVNQLD